VTILFADLAGSTTQQEHADAESVRHLMDRYYAAVRDVIAEYDGTLVKVMGDGVMAVFGVPNTAEDDALRAVHAAVAAQRAFSSLRSELGERAEALAMRVGVNTGEVVVSDTDDDVVGDPVNVAARLEQAADSGGVLIGESTRRLVSEHVTLAAAGELSLKGRADPVAAFRVVSLESERDTRTTVFVGRDAELQQLLKRVTESAERRRVGMAMVIGSPGLGKSRLLHEVMQRCSADATVLYARCDPTAGSTFGPVGDALRSLLGLDEGARFDAVRDAVDTLVPDDPERDRVVNGVSGLVAGAVPPTEEMFWVVRRMLGALGRDRVVLFVIDDLHWAEPLLLDLIEHVIEFGAEIPLFMLGAARPELRDARPALCTSGGMVGDVLLLDGLDVGAAQRLAADVIGTEALPDTIAAHVVAATEGNPLFLRELVRMLVDDGAIVRADDRWVAAVELADREMPPTIHALLAARIERLLPDERIVLERASVIGKEFSRAALVELLPAEHRADLDIRLDALCRRDFVERDTTRALGDRVYRFHHVLIRDAAYRRLLRGTRAQLHLEYADWLEAHESEAGADYDETAGWHLEQAHEHLLELGPVDDAGRRCGARAAEHLSAAGRRALARDDVAAAAGLLGRAIARLDDDEPERAELALDWCEALLTAGDVTSARSAINTLGASVGDSPRLEAWHTCFDAQLAVMTEPNRLRATADAVATAADVLRDLADEAGAAKAHWVHATALASLGEIGRCEAALDRALAAARAAGDRRRANAVLGGSPLAQLWGPSPVTRASGRCLDVVRVLRITAGAPAVEAVALGCQAVLEALRERTEAARRMISGATRIVQDLGVAPHILQTEMFAGIVELLAGEPAEAEAHLRTAYQGLRHRGLRVGAAQAAALLGRARLAQGDVVGAEQLSHESENLAGDDLKAGIAWRGVRAEALARRGDHVAAVALARDAVATASSTDALLDHADARVALSVALRAAGDLQAADAELSHAQALWIAKGATAFSRTGHESVQPTVPSRRAAPNAATANVERFRAAIRSRDQDALREVLAEESTFVHVPLGVTWDRDGILDSWETFFTADDVDFAMVPIETVGDSLALLRGRRTMSSYEQWGPSDTEEVVIIEVDSQGKRVRTELYDARDLTRAIARLHELSDRATRTFENAATRAIGAFDRAWAAHDWDAIKAAVAPAYRSTEARFAMVVDIHGDEAIADLCATFEFGESSWSTQAIAIRGERLALLHRQWRGAGQDYAQSELEFLDVIECDEAGRVLWEIAFEADDLDAAYSRLDQLYTDGEGKPYRTAVDAINEYCSAAAEGDWERVAARLSDDFTATNRRSTTNQGARATRQQWLAWLRTARDELGVHGRLRVENFVCLSHDAAVIAGTFSGSQDGGPFFGRVIVVLALDGDKLKSTDAYDTQDLDRALARYEELTRSTNTIENAATRAIERFAAVWSAGDWEGVISTMAPTQRLVDRRQSAQNELGPEEIRITLRNALDLGPSEWTGETIATRGDRLALTRRRWYGPGLGGAQSEMTYVEVLEVDEQGRTSWGASFDLDDLDAAFDELDNRFVGLEAAAAPAAWNVIRSFRRLVPAHDVDALVQLAAPGFALEDHRARGFGTLELAAYRGMLTDLFAMAPDTRLRIDHVIAIHPRAALNIGAWVGTVDGGPFEIALASVTEHIADGRASRWHAFAPEALDEARALYESITTTFPRENGAVRAMRRLRKAADRADWAAAEAACSPALQVDDRRPQAQYVLDRDQFLADLPAMYRGENLQLHTSLVATAGDRLALERVRWCGGAPGEEWVIENLLVIEADEQGRVVANVGLELDQRDEAESELRTRFLNGEGARHSEIAETMFAFAEAWSAHDIAQIAEMMAPDLVVEEHRHAGQGVISGKAAYLETLKVIFQLYGETRLETIEFVVHNERGMVSISRMRGRDVEGGEIEILFTQATRIRDRQLVRFDIFEIEDLDQAVHLLAASSHPASLARRESERAFDARDWNAMRALAVPGFVYEDRRAHALVHGDVETWIKAAGLIDQSARYSRESVAEIGATIAIDLVHWRGANGWEADVLQLTQVDELGRLMASLNFDSDDRRTAFDEALRRFRDTEGAPYVGTLDALARYGEAFGGRDLVRLRAAITEDFVLHDHRPNGLGGIEGADAYVASVSALHDLAPHVAAETTALMVVDHHGRVGRTRMRGEDVGGGAFESEYYGTFLVRDGKVARYELFDTASAALARFDELRPRA
jgi:class 3 adenylate cyclase/ketosteroid isomerase-like protein